MAEKKKMLLSVRQIVYIVIAVLVMAIMITADCLASANAPIISGFFGTDVQIDGDKNKVDAAAENGDEVVRKIANEGVALLKNDNVLPLPATTRKINIFGWGATDAGFLLIGNGSGRSYVHKDMRVGLLAAFKADGFEYNEEIIKIYEDWCTTEDKDWGEGADWVNRYNTKIKEPVTSSAFSDAVVERAKQFSDTAMVVISRYSGEYIGRIQSTQKKHGLSEDKTRNFSELSTEEESLLKMCTSNFKNVIVVFNTGSMFDMTFLDDGSVGAIGAAMNVGYMGQSGATAIPKILSGDVNPSGKLADIVLYNPRENEITRVNGESSDIVYAEDIYYGYKFCETADVEHYYDGKSFIGKTGYDAVVQYPFGHGLSYTKFDWEIEEVSLEDGAVLDKNSKIDIKVKVTNSGSVKGKDVVQLYLTAPYYKGGIEKAAVQLIDFQKTDEIAPGASDTVTFSLTPYELASYDCYDKNDNGTTGWELDVGDYLLKLMTDSHHVKPGKTTLTYKVEDDIIRYRKDPVSNGRVKNRYTGEFAYGNLPLDGSSLELGWKYLSRADFAGTMPTERSGGVTGKMLSAYSGYVYDDYDYTSLPVTEVENDLRLVTKADGSYVSKEEFTGEDKFDGALKYNDELIMQLGDPSNWGEEVWDKFLDQLTLEDLRTLVEDGGYGTRAIESIGKPVWLDYDGPSGFNRTNMSPLVEGSKFTAFPAENLVAQCWNKELLYQEGQIMGVDGQNFGIAGIYAPGVNLHREYLNGRNYEYYSEDPILSGYLAAYLCLGAKSNGTSTYVKHLALYDSSPYTSQRVWCTEQNFRESYMKPFEIAVKKGQASGIMVSFNKIGATWAGANQAMINGILRTEFGFKGVVVTDYDDGSDGNMVLKAGIRAGVNTQLNPKYENAGSNGVIDKKDPVYMNLARDSAKSIIYAFCNNYRYAKTNTDKNMYSVDIAGPRTIKKGFDWWILVVVFINIIAFGLLIWRGLFNFVPVLQRYEGARREKRAIRKKEKAAAKAAQSADASVVPAESGTAPPPVFMPTENDGDGMNETGSSELKAAQERIDALEEKLQTLETKLDEVLTKLEEQKPRARKPKNNNNG